MSFSPIPTTLKTDLAGLGTGVVLDLGCGDGRWTTSLRQHAPSVIALDKSQALAPAAEVVGDVISPPVQPHSCALVMAANLLRHLPNPHSALTLWRSLLVPGGILWVFEDEPAADGEPGVLYRDLQQYLKKLNPRGRGALWPQVRFESMIVNEPGWLLDSFTNEEQLQDKASLLLMLDQMVAHGDAEAARLATGLRQGPFSYGRTWCARWTERAGA